MEGKKRIILGVFALFAVLGLVFLPGYSRLQRLREENEQYLRRIEFLESRNVQLGEELVKMREDPEHVERKARQKLGIVKKGELIYSG
ncbi:MAG: septum formation initiator family protein [Candidatus Omnitrophota bacterium]